MEEKQEISIEQKQQILIVDEEKEFLPADVFKTENVNHILDEVRRMVKEFKQKADVTTKKGREEIASFAYKVSKTKTCLDGLGKKLTEDWLNKKRLVDDERKKIRDELDKLKEEARQPLTDYENRIQEHIDECNRRIQEIESFKLLRETTVEVLDKAILDIDKILEHTWEEFETKAKNIAEEVKSYLNSEKEKTIKANQEREELERLRKEKEERERKDREERIAKEAAEKAKRDAEEKAELEKRKMIEEQKRKEQEILIAKQKAEQEAKERESRIEAEKKAAELAKLEAERKAKEAEEMAKIARQKAIEEERARVEEEKRKQEEEIAKREANKKHKAKINNEAKEDIEIILKQNLDLIQDPEIVAKNIIIAIAEGKIRNVKINY